MADSSLLTPNQLRALARLKGLGAQRPPLRPALDCPRLTMLDTCASLKIEVNAMNVNLGETFEEYVRAQLETGRYNNASEVIREALRLKMQADDERSARLDALRRDIADAREQVQRGEVVETTADAFLKRRGRRRG